MSAEGGAPAAPAISSHAQPASGPAANSPQHAWIANFIWGIADDVLRDVYVRGKYRDVILSNRTLASPNESELVSRAALR